MDDDAYIREAERRWGKKTWCPHDPTERQAAFLKLDCKEALYGGAAGGGKSDALLMAALQYVHVPRYSALLLRRTFADLNLPEAIMDRSKTWLMGTAATWNDRDKCWTFPSGAKLTFGYLDNDRDRYRYQSAAFQFVGWDELTQFPELWYRYLFSRLRRPSDASMDLSHVPLRMRSATNPGGIGHKWVKKRFVDEKTAAAPFIKSKLDDNPHVDKASYLDMLGNVDPTTRKQLEDGSWVQDSSGLVFSHFDTAKHVMPAKGIDRRKWRFILGVDFGYNDETAFVILGWEAHSQTVRIVYSEKHVHLIPSAAAERTKELERDWAFDRIVGDTQGLGKGYAEEARQRFTIPMHPAKKVNKLGYIKLMNGAFSNGQLIIDQEANAELVAELEELPWGDEAHTKEAEGFANHLTDAALYGWREVKAFAEDPEEVEPPEPTADEIQAQMRQAHIDRWQQRKDDQAEGLDWFQRRHR